MSFGDCGGKSAGVPVFSLFRKFHRLLVLFPE